MPIFRTEAFVPRPALFGLRGQ